MKAVAAALAAAAVASCSATSAPAPASRVAGTSGSSPGTRSATTSNASRLHVSTLLRLPVGVSRTVVVAQGSNLLVLGGLAPGDSTTARAWRIDVTTRHATQSAPLKTAVHDASGAIVAGKPTVFGGGAASTVAAVQQWSTAGGHVVGRLPQPRSDSAAAVVGTTAYVVGGFSGSGMTRDVLATSDGRTFRVVGRLRVGVRYPAVAAVGGAVYVVGGALATTEGTASGAQTADVQRIDVTTGKVTIVGRLAQPLAHATAFALGGALYVAGGRHGATATSAVVRIDLRTGAATRVASLPHGLSDAAAAVVGSTAYLVGGETSGPAAPASTVLALRAA